MYIVNLSGVKVSAYDGDVVEPLVDSDGSKVIAYISDTEVDGCLSYPHNSKYIINLPPKDGTAKAYVVPKEVYDFLNNNRYDVTTTLMI